MYMYKGSIVYEYVHVHVVKHGLTKLHVVLLDTTSSSLVL